MWIGDKVIYTPEIITITRGEPIESQIESIGTDGLITIIFPNGDKKRVEIRLCAGITREQRE